jgi:Cu(I)/Ag(I) efflux system membrane fusion protein
MDETAEPARRGAGRKVGVILAIAAALVAGYLAAGALERTPPAPPAAGPETAAPAAHTDAEHAAGHQPETELWTCTMHPQIRLPHPGKCPICGMDLVPVRTAESAPANQPGGEGGLRRLVITEEAKALLKIQTSPVERKFVTMPIRMVGKVQYDETRLRHIAAWTPGRLDRLFVDYTGLPVAKGDHMVEIYSPQLVAAQEELILAIQAVKDLAASQVDVVKQAAQRGVEASRDKLRLLGLTNEQIADVEKSGKAADHVTIYAPMSGTVIEKDAREGMYVDAGTRIYTIADLSEVWVKLDAYESDLPWLRYGQAVTFATAAWPGEKFVGRIAFVDPVLDDRTRTVKVRVDVPNAQGKLKPEMYVNGIVEAEVADGGRVIAADLAGKWMCPMHPWVIKDGPGACPICGMALKTVESLGYTPASAAESAKPLVIPASAPLITGQRAVVYVEAPGAEKPTYDGVEIVLGPRAGDYYIVRSGLQEGQRVVTHGNFNLDSALQIQAKPSMMSPEGGGAPAGHVHGGMPMGEMPKEGSPPAATRAAPPAPAVPAGPPPEHRHAAP